MNALFPRVFVLTAIGLASVIFAACSKQERASASAKAKETYAEASSGVKDAYQDTKVALSKAWSEAKEFSFEQRDAFAAKARALSADAESQVSQLRAEYAEERASASRKAAMAELKNAESDYKQKVAALGNASAATWDSAKQNVIAAWDRLQAAYRDARAD